MITGFHRGGRGPQARRQAPGERARCRARHGAKQGSCRPRTARPGATGARKTQGRAVPRDSEGAWVSDFQPAELGGALSLKPAGLCHFVTAALGNRYRFEMYYFSLE